MDVKRRRDDIGMGCGTLQSVRKAGEGMGILIYIPKTWGRGMSAPNWFKYFSSGIRVHVHFMTLFNASRGSEVSLPSSIEC